MMDDKLKATIDKELDKAAAEQERYEQHARRIVAAVNHAPDLAEACIAIRCANNVALPNLDEMAYMSAALAAFDAAKEAQP